MHQALARSGEECSPELVRRLMRELGLEPCQPKPCRHSLTEQDGAAPPAPDLVNRDFTAEKPGQKMVGDITYIPTWQGWVFLAAVIDCATRKIVGWAMDRTQAVNAYKTREQLLDKVDWEGGPAEFILGHSIDPADLREGIPNEVAAAVTRLVTQGEADLKSFIDWLCTGPDEDENQT